MLLCPSDNDEMHSFIMETKFGYIANDEKNCERIILDCLNRKTIKFNIKDYKKNFKRFSREYQTEILANILKEKI